jgi:methyl-accepting chemotaxis protein
MNDLVESNSDTSKNAVLSETIDKIKKIAVYTEKTSDELGSIGEILKQMEYVLTETKKNRRRTRILSVNAAIEASKAGDKGKGFSIVADEINELAESSTRYAQKIKDLISQIQEKTKTASQTIDSGSKKILETSYAIEVTVNSMRNIISKIESLGPVCAELESILNSNSQVCREASKQSTQNHKSAQELAKRADELYLSTLKFKLYNEQNQ